MIEISSFDFIEDEYNQIENENAWPTLFQKINSDCTYDEFSQADAKNSVNKKLNRWSNVLPYDHSRIILEHEVTDYINASLVKVEGIDRRYILTQGPLANTTAHFWLMVWQQQCKAIVMLNKLIEKNQEKCYQYWPKGSKNGDRDILEFPNYDVTVKLLSESKHRDYIYRNFKLSHKGESRTILHFHYTAWPDFGVPSCPEAFNKFLSAVIASGSLEPDVGPPIVHCSAGIGRSGTFCLVDTILIKIQRGVYKIGATLETLGDMRRYRPGLIQTPEQLRFSYLAIIDAIRNGPTALANGNASSSSSCEDISEESDPVPCPPTRTDSLSRTTGDESPPDFSPTEEISERSLPSVPDSSSEDDSSGDEGAPPPLPPHAPSVAPEILSAQLDSIVRQRKREVRQDEMRKKVCDIQEGMRKSETSQRRKRRGSAEPPAEKKLKQK